MRSLCKQQFWLGGTPPHPNPFPLLIIICSNRARALLGRRFVRPLFCGATADAGCAGNVRTDLLPVVSQPGVAACCCCGLLLLLLVRPCLACVDWGGFVPKSGTVLTGLASNKRACLASMQSTGTQFVARALYTIFDLAVGVIATSFGR